jgi:hypothetical protein
MAMGLDRQRDRFRAAPHPGHGLVNDLLTPFMHHCEAQALQ